MIKLIRLDYRLLHGQVCFTWVQHESADRIIIIDNASAMDDLKKSALKLAKPQGIRLNVFSVEVAIKKAPKIFGLDENIIMIFGDTSGLARFCKLYPDVASSVGVNYGATANKENAKQIDESVFLNSSELEDTREILSLGVPIYSQQTPILPKKQIKEV
jgi:PTS system mannose-specific IIB component